jgi:hypothetical protein
VSSAAMTPRTCRHEAHPTPHALYIHPWCGCQLSPVRGWVVDGEGPPLFVLECLLCRATWLLEDEWMEAPLDLRRGTL